MVVEGSYKLVNIYIYIFFKKKLFYVNTVTDTDTLNKLVYVYIHDSNHGVTVLRLGG